jgi:hypothetical protein
LFICISDAIINTPDIPSLSYFVKEKRIERYRDRGAYSPATRPHSLPNLLGVGIIIVKVVCQEYMKYCGIFAQSKNCGAGKGVHC